MTEKLFLIVLIIKNTLYMYVDIFNFWNLKGGAFSPLLPPPPHGTAPAHAAVKKQYLYALKNELSCVYQNLQKFLKKWTGTGSSRLDAIFE